MGFLLVLGSILAINVGWWRWAHRRLGELGTPRRRALQAALAVFAGVPLLYLLSLIVVPGIGRRAHDFLPMALLAWVYLWHMIALPLAAIAIGLGKLVRVVRARLRRAPPPPAGDPVPRRAFLGACAVAAPPLATGFLTAWSMPRLNDLRLRELEVAVPGLPPALDGLVVAHLSDLHVGKFTTEESIEEFVAAVNGMRADLLLFSGDLIDLSLTDLPRACAVMRRLEPQGRLYLCEGNHDLIDDGDGFRRGVRDEGLTLLRDAGTTIEVRGVPVQLLGTRWARGSGGRREAAALLEPLRDPQAFPILLAHHPHVFDAAPEFPLVLSGHTHGGMLMLTEHLGAGPVLYRYWSGPYRVGARSIVVSNGAGNWFPLRTNSPAEVGRIVLRA